MLIKSPKIGSRYCTTLLYFDDKKTQIVCGCFKGNIAQFKDEIEKTHGDSKHGKDYKSWLKMAEEYISSAIKLKLELEDK